jgi:hypothetical protein
MKQIQAKVKQTHTLEKGQDKGEKCELCLSDDNHPRSRHATKTNRLVLLLRLAEFSNIFHSNRLTFSV